MVRFASVIIAAGRGTRMKSALPKVLHPLAGKPLIAYPVELARSLGANPVCAVIPPKSSEIKACVESMKAVTVRQTKPLGTADAVRAAQGALAGFQGYVLILSGDVPLLCKETIRAFLESVVKEKATLGLISMKLDDPAAYGRVVRDLEGKVAKIVEAKEASARELDVREVNAGVYCVEKRWLFQALKRVKLNNHKGEFYLTDILELAVNDGHRVVAHCAEDPEEFYGINTRVDLERAAAVLRRRINEKHMLDGVTIVDGTQVSIDSHVRIGTDTTIFPGVSLLGKTRVGKGCIIENGVVLKDAIIGDGVCVYAMSVIESSRIEEGASIGPFARIRPDSVIGIGAKVGNFVELKKCRLKAGAKASHLTYLGDAVIGERANVGCGTITCNYDGFAKHRTVIGDEAFIGSDTQLVAPVKIGRGATVGAGSTITKNVPPHSLALSRTPQVAIKDWVPRALRRSKRARRKA